MNNLTKALLILIFVALMILVIMVASRPGPPMKATQNPIAEQGSQIHFEQLVEDTIQCAALIAITESIVSGNIEAGSDTFNQISNTLGQAKLYAANGKMDSNYVVQRYQQLSVDYLQRFHQHRDAELQQTAATHQHCVEQARSYSPDQQIKNMIQKAQKMASESHIDGEVVLPAGE